MFRVNAAKGRTLRNLPQLASGDLFRDAEEPHRDETRDLTPMSQWATVQRTLIETEGRAVRSGDLRPQNSRAIGTLADEAQAGRANRIFIRVEQTSQRERSDVETNWIGERH